MTTELPSDRHWDEVYGRVGAEQVSWFQTDAAVSLSMIAAAGGVRSVVDVGAGASVLVDGLLEAGIGDVTLVDVSASALQTTRERVGPRAATMRFVVADVRQWRPGRRFDVWHDRAVFHFLTEPADRAAYRRTLRQSLAAGGHVVIGTFAADGPTHCSGLPVARYDPRSLGAQFPDLRVVGSRRVEHVTPAGVVQPFTWLLLTAGRPTTV
jgi:SAM-dependent methyltransferase